MAKLPSTQETDKLTIDAIENYLLRHTVQLFIKTEDGMSPFGSGVLAVIHDNYFILTASHVADHLEKEGNELFLRANETTFANVVGEIKYTDIDKSNGIDLAYIKLDPQLATPMKKNYKFITIDKLAKHNLVLDATNYCVLGFPQENLKVDNGTIKTGASYFLTSAMNDKPYSHYKLSKADAIVVLMNGKAFDMKTKKMMKHDSDFHGLSGCGLWLLIYIFDPITKTNSVDYRLIGIMTDFKKGKFFCLIGYKIHLLLEALTKIEGYKFREKPALYKLGK